MDSIDWLFLGIISAALCGIVFLAINKPSAVLETTCSFGEHYQDPRIDAAVFKVPAYSPNCTCLCRAKALKKFLAEEGINSTIELGIANSTAAMGHAWIQAEIQITPMGLTMPGLKAQIEIFGSRDGWPVHFTVLDYNWLVYGKQN